MSIQVTMWGSSGSFRRYGWGWGKDAWQHIVVCWDTANPAGATLGLYKNGVETGYPASYKAIEPPTTLQVGCQPKGGAASARALLDEIAVYRGALNASQVKVLYQAGDRPVVERAALTRAARRGRCGARSATHRPALPPPAARADSRASHSLVNWGDNEFTPLRLPVPDKIHEDELVNTDLSQYHTLYVPGGGGLRLTDEKRRGAARVTSARVVATWVSVVGRHCRRQYELIEATRTSSMCAVRCGTSSASTRLPKAMT